MIKFFRKIRQELLANNKVSKYLLYAIGEIALVVIGILIALQINNNNEERKLHTLQIQSLQEIKRALVSDLKDIDFNARRHRDAQISTDIILNALNTDLPYHDSLGVHFERTTNITIFLPSLGPYETLKARGLDLIESDTLRNAISGYYEQAIKFAMAFEDANLRMWPFKTELVLDYFDEFLMFDTATPVDYEKLKNDRRFKSFLKMTARLRDIESNMYKNRMHNDCTNLMELIEQEVTKGQ